MYIWNIFKALIYLIYCSKKCVYSDPNDKGSTKLIPIDLNVCYGPLADEFMYQKSDQVGVYTVNNGYAFASVKAFGSGCEKGSDIWKAQNHLEYAKKVILVLHNVYGMYKLMVHLFNGKKKEFFKQINVPWIEIRTSKDTRIPLNIHIQHNTNFYTVKKHGFVRIYTPKTGFIFESIIHLTDPDDLKRTIWKADNIDECAISVKYILYRFAKPKFGILMIYLSSGKKIKLVNDDVDYIGNPWIPVDPHGDTVIQISILKESNSFCYYNYLRGHLSIFEAKMGFVFNGLLKWNEKHRSFEVIWQTLKPDKYTKKVVYEKAGINSDTTNIMIAHVNGEFTHLRLVGDGWSPIDPSVILDINYTFINIVYEYRKNKHDVESFIPNGNYLFKGVMTTSGLVFQKEIGIWNAKNRREYAKKVFIVPLDKNVKCLVIFLVNNDFLLFQKSGNSKWTKQPKEKYLIDELRRLLGSDLFVTKAIKQDEEDQTTPYEISPHPGDMLNVVDYHRSDIGPEKLVELDINKFDRIKEYDIKCAHNKVVFTAKEPYLFSIVKNEDSVLWQPKNYEDYPYRVIYKIVDGNPKIKVYFPDDKRLERTKNKHLMNYNPFDIEVMVVKGQKPDRIE